MTHRAPLFLSLLVFACQNPAGPPAAKTGPEVKATEPPAKSDPHAAAPHGANPHAGDPHAGGPHGAAGPAVETKRPAREAVNPHPVTPSGQTREEVVPGLNYKVPEEWTRKPGSSAMRLAEFVLPGPGGDAELAVYRFAGGGGDAKSNVHRWRTQFAKSDGSPLGDEDGEVQEVSKPPLKVTLVDLSGTYIAQVTPGASERYSDPNYRMLAAIVEGAGDPYFFKAVGPETTLAVWKPTFATFADAITVVPAK
ncbi:hypothetical protein [Nannocystis pusilla]|uniref:hypothetical protein n=1 Tax=Nannocystis pusilla TaxID=889268 RepID=UPI003DA1E268